MIVRAKPTYGMHRATAEQLFRGVLARAHEVNAPTSPFAICVKRIFVFGSYLKGKDRPNDVDFIVEYGHRDSDPVAQHARVAERMKYYKGQNIIVDRVLWPYTEVRRFLQNRSSRISLHGTDELDGLRAAGELIEQVFP